MKKRKRTRRTQASLPSLPTTQTIQNNFPTPERARKKDYERTGTGTGKRFKRASTLAFLRNKGELTSEMEEAASRWLSDFTASTAGYFETAHQESLSSELVGNRHTYSFSRAFAGIRIKIIKDIIGEKSHHILLLMLAESYSFLNIGTKLFPGIGNTQAITRASSACAIVLSSLPGAYTAMAKIIRDERQRELAMQDNLKIEEKEKYEKEDA